MNLLVETPVGFGIFQIKHRSKLNNEEYVHECIESPEGIKKIVKLSVFEKFKNVEQALKFEKRMIDGRLSKKLSKVVNNSEKIKSEQFVVCDQKIGLLLKEKFDIECVTSPIILDIVRGIREHITSLVADIDESQLKQMSLALAHGYSRYKLKFSPTRVDTMIIQGIKLIDDLDKELNNYIMRCKEWYGLHFPELVKHISDNITYVRVVKRILFKTNAISANLTDLVDNAVQGEIRAAATVSSGTDVTEDDMNKISRLCDQVIEIADYRAQLFSYVTFRMKVVAPNLSIIVGEIVGARLIAHAGSLYNLSKNPASTIQLLGAEKALFSALKARKNTPKYGLIYHSDLVSSASAPCKGKMARSLAAKCALAARCDALSEKKIETDLAIRSLNKLNCRLKEIEQLSSTNNKKLATYQHQTPQYVVSGQISTYKSSNDIMIPTTLKRKAHAEKDQITEVSSKSLKTETDQPSKKKKNQS